MNLRQEILLSIKRGNLGIIPLKGTSMLPTLSDGDILYVYAQQDYFIGDIVVFLYPQEGYLVHRIIKMEKGAIMCKGDNSKRIEVIMKRQIVGKVIDHISEQNK